MLQLQKNFFIFAAVFLLHDKKMCRQVKYL
jgi:hypothetical protein